MCEITNHTKSTKSKPAYVVKLFKLPTTGGVADAYRHIVTKSTTKMQKKEERKNEKQNKKKEKE